mgnify:CR=1 FL=1
MCAFLTLDSCLHSTAQHGMASLEFAQAACIRYRHGPCTAGHENACPQHIPVSMLQVAQDNSSLTLLANCGLGHLPNSDDSGLAEQESSRQSLCSFLSLLLSGGAVPLIPSPKASWPQTHLSSLPIHASSTPLIPSCSPIAAKVLGPGRPTPVPGNTPIATRAASAAMRALREAFSSNSLACSSRCWRCVCMDKQRGFGSGGWGEELLQADTCTAAQHSPVMCVWGGGEGAAWCVRSILNITALGGDGLEGSTFVSSNLACSSRCCRCVCREPGGGGGGRGRAHIVVCLSTASRLPCQPYHMKHVFTDEVCYHWAAYEVTLTCMHQQCSKHCQKAS